MTAAGRSRPTILVIDDEPTIRKSVGRLLERAGYRVRTAGTGAEALELVRSRALRRRDLRPAHRRDQRRGAVRADLAAAPDLAGHLMIASGDLTGEGVDELVERAGVPPVAKPFTAADLLRAVGPSAPRPGRIARARVRKAAS